MDCPIFSQIPSAILHKLEPNKKRVKFLQNHSQSDDSDNSVTELNSPERNDVVTSSYVQPSPKDLFKTPTHTHVKPTLATGRKIVSKTEAIVDLHQEKAVKLTADAIVQTISKIMVEKATQTDNLPPARPCICQRTERQNAEANSLGAYKPMYAIPKKNGEQPPLKIGLSLPKGKRRCVYYPDEEYVNNTSEAA